MVSTPKQRENLPCRTCCRPMYRRCISFPGAGWRESSVQERHGLSPCLRNDNNLKPGETFNEQPTEDQKARIRMLTEVECERLQGFPDDFTRYGIFNEEVDTISRANRYAMLGNAVSVPVVRTIAERIRRNTVLND